MRVRNPGQQNEKCVCRAQDKNALTKRYTIYYHNLCTETSTLTPNRCAELGILANGVRTYGHTNTKTVTYYVWRGQYVGACPQERRPYA